MSHRADPVRETDASASERQKLSVVVIIPVYKALLTERESQRVALTVQNCPRHEVVLIGPEGLKSSFRDELLRGLPFAGFAPQNFESVQTYNSWVLQPELYRTFGAHEFVLLCQTDAMLVRPLPSSSNWKFDYLGAPWVPPFFLKWDRHEGRLIRARPWLRSRRLVVGNGGLSLRRTSVFSDLPKLPNFKKFPNEDILISYFHRELGIRLASEHISSKYFMETEAARWRVGDVVPDVFGFHGLQRFNPSLEDHVLSTTK